MPKTILTIEPLSKAAFAPFGDVVELEGAEHFTTNQGQAERFHDLAKIDVAREGGRPVLSVFRTEPWTLPLRIILMERHPISSQAFVPMSDAPFLVVVAKGGQPPRPGDLRAFRTNGRQGINYAPGTWHHPLLALVPGDFLTIDRTGSGPGHDQDLDEIEYEQFDVWIEAQ
jgi:ureidoglycolate lyase